MSFFNKNSINKTLLIYEGGGIGDKIMFSRLIPILCNKYINNKILFILNKNIFYLFNQLFQNLKNLEIICFSKIHHLSKFDYHCNLQSLIYYLKLNYENITFYPLFEKINYKINNIQQNIINDLKNHKKNFIFNWKGNNKNTLETTRRLDLNIAIPLFKLSNINWIVITKDITYSEMNILNSYNVKYYGNKIDNTSNSFEDSINIIKNVDAVISTDTSLVHLSANLNIKTFVLLSTASEWRWTYDKTTNWYPNSILIRQKKFNEWNTVIEELISYL